LTEREVDVLRLVAGGLPNKAIANSLSITPKTVEHHVQHISGADQAMSPVGALRLY
jgi:DNA-binding NarL/FixJ family response regulator